MENVNWDAIIDVLGAKTKLNEDTITKVKKVTKFKRILGAFKRIIK